MKKETLKKILAAGLALAMVFCLAGCGNKNAESEAPVTGEAEDSEVMDDEDFEGELEIDGDDPYADLDFSDLVADDDDYSEDAADYDFHETLSENFAMKDCISEVYDTSNLENAGDQIKSLIEKAGQETLKTEVDASTEYDPTDDGESEMGEWLNGLAITKGDDEFEGSYVECGVYMKHPEDKYSYYGDYCSLNVYEPDDAVAAQIAEEAKTALGIDISAAEMKNAFTTAFDRMKADDLDVFYLQSMNQQSGNGFDETISIMLTVMNDGNGGGISYITCERERIYQ